MTDMLPLLKFQTIFKSTVWGGRRIADFKGIPSQGDNIGESWEISPLEGAESVVSEGEFKRMTIGQLTRQYSNEILGRRVKDKFGSIFPLLIKFIDSNSDLSIQVHPDDEYAVKKYGANAIGKTEFWYALSPTAGAYVYSGFSRQTTPDDLRLRIDNQTLTDVLARYDVEAGDVFFYLQGEYTQSVPGTF